MPTRLKSTKRQLASVFLSGAPGPDAADAFGRDVYDLAGGWVVEGWELHTWSEIHLGESLQQLGCAARDEAGLAVHNEGMAG